MQRSFLPSMSALTAFESAGRHLSFSRAAAELHLTQGAISRQIRQLEDGLGLALFERINQRVFLTDAGRAYLREVQSILGTLAGATRRAMAEGGRDGVVTLAVLPTFATRWLIPRLPGFLKDHPHATVHFRVHVEPFSFTDEPADAAIHHGEATWPGAICEHLCDEAVVPVAAPDLARALKITTPADLAAAPLLHQSTRPAAWADWFEREGVPADNPYRGARFDQFGMIAAAAAAGLGIALVPRFLVEEELASGRLSILFDRPLASGTAYWFVYPEAKAGSVLVRALGDWLKTAAAP